MHTNKTYGNVFRIFNERCLHYRYYFQGTWLQQADSLQVLRSVPGPPTVSHGMHRSVYWSYQESGDKQGIAIETLQTVLYKISHYILYVSYVLKMLFLFHSL